MKKFISNKYLLFFLGILLVIGIWFILSAIFDKGGAIFPSPVLTMQKLGELLVDYKTYREIGYSLLRMLGGFSASLLLALLFGVIAGNHPNIYQFLKPIMTVIKSIPTVAIVYLVIVIISPKNAPLAVVFIICFPILYEGVVGGIKNIDKDVIEASRVDGATYFKSIIFVKIPLAVPYIMVSIVSSFALSFKIEIMAEVIAGLTQNGLGSVIYYEQLNKYDDMTGIFAYSFLAVTIVLLVTLLEEVVKNIIKKHNVVRVNNN